MAEGKKVLIVSYYFAPQNVIGAVRATKLAKYLSRMGHEVTVICGEGITDLQDPTLAKDLMELSHVHRVREWNPIRDRKQKSAGTQISSGEGVLCQAAASSHSAPRRKIRRTGLKGRIMDKVYLLLLLLADGSFGRQAIKALRSMNLCFDVVISSYGPMSDLLIGQKAKQEGYARYWIADFRDKVSVPFSWLEGHATRQRKRAAKQADGVSAVSQGVLEAVEGLHKGRVLPNGFDLEDLQTIQAEERGVDQPFCFVYSGQLYMGKRDLSPFFEAMGELIKEGFCNSADVEVVYVGNEGEILKQQAQKCGMEALVRDLGRVSREKSLSLQKGADALLLASWNERGDTGVLTGKLLEYFMVEKPIVCCMSGDVPQSEIKRLLGQGELGFCYEQAAAAEDQEALKGYLRTLLTRKREGKPLGQPGGMERVQAFSYPRIAEEFSRWMEDMTHEDCNRGGRKTPVH